MSSGNAGISARQYGKLYRNKKEGTVKKAVEMRKSSRKRLIDAKKNKKPKSGTYAGASGTMTGLHDAVVKTTSLGEYTSALLANESSNHQKKKK